MGEHTERRPILELGSRVQVGSKWWTVAAVGNGPSFGERYYWLRDTQGTVYMAPANMVEPAAPPLTPIRTDGSKAP